MITYSQNPTSKQPLSKIKSNSEHSYIHESMIISNKVSFSHLEESNNKNEEQEYYEQRFDTISEDISIPHGLHRKCQSHEISEIFRHIQKPIDYENMLFEEILVEKQLLEDHVKFMNQQLNEMMKKKISKIEDGISRKIYKGKKNNSRLKYNEWDDAGIEMQINNNNKFVLLLRDEYEFLKNKLNKIEGVDYKAKFDQKIKQAKEEIQKMKMLLLERKKKNILNTKKIKEYDKDEVHKVFFEMQQEYIGLTKKKQQYTKKITKLTEDNAKVTQDYAQLQYRYFQLKNQAVSLIKKLPNQAQSQHTKVMYDAKCRKLQLSLRKGQRDEESYKRKYYNLLKDYQKYLQSIKGLDEKLKCILSMVEEANREVSYYSKKLEQQKQKPAPNYRLWKTQGSDEPQQQKKEQESYRDEQENQVSGFMLTELMNKNPVSRTEKHIEGETQKHKYKTQPHEERFKKPQSDPNFGQQHPKKLLPLKMNTDPNEQYRKISRTSKASSDFRGRNFRNTKASNYSKREQESILMQKELSHKQTQRIQRKDYKIQLQQKQQSKDYNKAQFQQYEEHFGNESPILRK